MLHPHKKMTCVPVENPDTETRKKIGREMPPKIMETPRLFVRKKTENVMQHMLPRVFAF